MKLEVRNSKSENPGLR